MSEVNYNSAAFAPVKYTTTARHRAVPRPEARHRGEPRVGMLRRAGRWLIAEAIDFATHETPQLSTEAQISRIVGGGMQEYVRKAHELSADSTLPFEEAMTEYPQDPTNPMVELVHAANGHNYPH